MPGPEVAPTAPPRPGLVAPAAGSPAQKSGWPFVVPAVLLLLALNVFPLLFSLAMSFSNVSTDNGLRLTSATLGN
jgi:ABC-type sugar transport system permease subunit